MTGFLLLASPPPAVGAGLQINLVSTASWLTAPADYQAKMITAANKMMAAFPGTNCTINIQLEYATFLGTSMPNRNSGSTDNDTTGVSYSSVIKPLLAAIPNPTADLTSMISNLPAGSTLGGQSIFHMSFGVCKAIGLFSTGGAPANATDAGLDGFIGMGTGWTSAETLGVSLHELRQAMGGIAGRGTFNFSRFLSAGVWDAGAANSAYFSLDGGTTNLVTYDTTSDPADFVNGTTDPGSGLWDCFDASQNGSLQDLSPLNLRSMRALGYR